MKRFRSTLAVACLFLVVSVMGCSLLPSVGGSPSGADAKDVTVIEHPAKFDRSAIQIASFEIEEASVEGNVVKLRVSYRGGCDEHAFELYSTYGIYYSNPPQADVYLSHADNDDACRQRVREEVAFDLSPLTNSSESGALHLRLHPYEATTPRRPMPLYEY